MSGFWESDLGEVTGTPADAFAKSFTRVPDGTSAIAKIESFVNDDQQGIKSLVVNWLLTDGDFKGATVSQKLKVLDAHPQDKDPIKTRHRGLNMMKLMYQLFGLKPNHANAPSDDDLKMFAGKIAGILIKETDPNEKGNTYNWVAEIHDSKGFKCETGIKLEVVHSRDNLDSAFSRNPKGHSAEMEIDIPF